MNEKFKEAFERIKSATDIKTMTELGLVVGSSQQYVSKKSKEGEFPPAWAFEVTKKYAISTDWILTGNGQAKINEKVNLNPLLNDVNEWLNEEEKHKDAEFRILFRRQMIRAFFDYEEWVKKRKMPLGDVAENPITKVA